jgi:putative methyltransferase (TIGR04325 family)
MTNTSDLRTVVKDFVPPVILRVARRIQGRGIRFEGVFDSWKDAREASSGYEQGEIAQRIYEAECKVHSGDATDERDGVLFQTVQFSLPVMAALARAAFARKGRLRVLDFGGAFGGTYRQYCAFGLPRDVAWNVVEQSDFVKLGRSFESPDLRFFTTVEEVLEGGLPDVVLFSSVLQYLEDPFDVLRKFVLAGVPQVVIDRTPCADADEHLLTVQKVPREIYKASYPCWIFSRSRFLSAMEEHYRVVAAFGDSTGRWQGPGRNFDLAGLILDRRA